MNRKVLVDFDVGDFHQQKLPQDEEVHQCVLLKYLNRYLHYVRTPHRSRWRLIVPKESTGTDDLNVLDYVLFCPCCGEDLRQHTSMEAPGNPQLESLLEKV